MAGAVYHCWWGSDTKWVEFFPVERGVFHWAFAVLRGITTIVMCFLSQYNGKLMPLNFNILSVKGLGVCLLLRDYRVPMITLITLKELVRWKSLLVVVFFKLEKHSSRKLKQRLKRNLEDVPTVQEGIICQILYRIHLQVSGKKQG